MRVLVLGGTGEGHALARALVEAGKFHVVSSLAGRTKSPRLPPGELRLGGFGGAEGLARYLSTSRIDALVDATHPFAATMGRHAAEAARAQGVPLLRLERPPWRAVAGDNWREVEDWEEAVAVLRASARRVFLAIGRQELAAFAPLAQVWFLIRAVERPDPMPPFAQAEVLLARGPFALEDERRLLVSHRIDTVVCKNSGGSAAEAKLTAARELGLGVVMRRRPVRPSLPTVSSTEEALAWLAALGSA